MQAYVLNRPDRGAVAQLLERERYRAAGVIVRLAWELGLVREEIAALRWEQVDLPDREVRLPDRAVPLPEALAAFLSSLAELRGRSEGPVVLSDRDALPLAPQSISRLARLALDRAGQTKIRLIDLRHDFVLSQLEEHDGPYVSRICGIDMPTLRAHFAQYLPQKHVQPAAPAGPQMLDEVRLWRALQAEGASAAGLTLWLTWRLGLSLRAVAGLKWEQVDLAAGTLQASGRNVTLPAQLARLLQAVCPEEPTGPVLLTPVARGAYDPDRLSKVVRSRLVAAGLDHVTLRALRMDYALRIGGEQRVTAYVKAHGTITRQEAVRVLQVSATTAHSRLKALQRGGRLVQVGMKYYLPGTVVPPERQAEEIRAYLSREGFAYRQDIARLLRVGVGQCAPILRRLVSAGELVQVRQKYYLKEA
jgi:integrase